MTRKHNLMAVAPAAMALEGYLSPDVTYTPTTNIAVEGIADEIKRTYHKVVTTLTGTVSEKDKEVEKNDAAVEAMEKGLRYLKSQVSSAKFDRAIAADIGKGLRKMGLGVAPGENKSVLKGMSRKLNALEAAVGQAELAADKARGGHLEEVDKLLKGSEGTLKKDYTSTKGSTKFAFTKGEILSMIDEGLQACAVYKRARKLSPEKVAGSKVAMEALDEGDVLDQVIKSAKAVCNFILKLAVVVLQFVISIFIVVVLLVNPMMFLFGVAAAAVLQALFSIFASNDDGDHEYR